MKCLLGAVVMLGARLRFHWLMLWVVLAASAAWAQPSSFVPAHHSIGIASPVSGATNIRPAFNRRLLGLINNSSNVVFCTVDGVNAAVDEGIRLAATGTTGDRILFDRNVPQGPVRCYSATEGNRVLIIEGR